MATTPPIEVRVMDTEAFTRYNQAVRELIDALDNDWDLLSPAILGAVGHVKDVVVNHG